VVVATRAASHGSPMASSQRLTAVHALGGAVLLAEAVHRLAHVSVVAVHVGAEEGVGGGGEHHLLRGEEWSG
jgi:hypothetical protein